MRCRSAVGCDFLECGNKIKHPGYIRLLPDGVSRCERQQPPPPPSQPLVLRHASGDVSVLACVLGVLPHPERKLQPASEPASPRVALLRSAFAPGRGGVTQKKGDDDDIISGCPTARAGKRRATAATLNSPAPPGLGVWRRKGAGAARGGLGIPSQRSDIRD